MKKGVERNEENDFPYSNNGICCFVPYYGMSAAALKTGTAACANLGAVIDSAVPAAGKPAATVLLTVC